MFARVSWIIVTTLALFFHFHDVFVHAQQQGSSNADLVSQVCLGCICEVSTGCNVTVGCVDSICGPFAITWGYWSDAGKPTLNDEPNTNEGAYGRCVNDIQCAARAVQGYMAKFGQDCTGNSIIDCDDYVRIHRLGGFGCTTPLDQKYESRYKLCMQVYGR